MRPKESEYPADWVRIAEKDWRRVRTLLGASDPDLAGFCLQQAVEKFLKAYLLAQGNRLRRIHDLSALLDDAVAHDAALEVYRAVCQRITGFYIIDRYPIFVDTSLNPQDVETALKQVTPMIEGLRKQIET